MRRRGFHLHHQARSCNLAWELGFGKPSFLSRKRGTVFENYQKKCKLSHLNFYAKKVFILWVSLMFQLFEFGRQKFACMQKKSDAPQFGDFCPRFLSSMQIWEGFLALSTTNRSYLSLDAIMPIGKMDDGWGEGENHHSRSSDKGMKNLVRYLPILVGLFISLHIGYASPEERIWAIVRVFEAECIIGIARIGTMMAGAFVLFEGREQLVPLRLVGEGRRGGHGRGFRRRFGGQRGSRVWKLPGIGSGQSMLPLLPLVHMRQFVGRIGWYLISQKSYKQKNTKIKT